MNENSTKKAYLKEQLAQTDTVLTTKLARVGTTMVAILLGLLLVACPSDSSNGGTGGGNGGGTTPRPIAIWGVASQEGDFGLTLCQTRLTAGESVSGDSVEKQLFTAGYRTARFFGSTPDYAFTALTTDAEGLALTAAQAASTGTGALGVAAYAGDGTATPTTTFGDPAAAQTVGALIGGGSAVTNGGGTTYFSLSAAATAILQTVTLTSVSRLFWSFTDGAGVYDSLSENNCYGATRLTHDGTISGTTDRDRNQGSYGRAQDIGTGDSAITPQIGGAGGILRSFCDTPITLVCVAR